jgi:hypothetical protein
MKRTRSVMTGVTASMFLAGLLPTSPALGQTSPSPPVQEKGDSKGDPRVLAAADTIYDWFKGTTAQRAKTKNDIMKQFPAMTPDLVDQALGQLIYDGRIKRQGDGSATNPYSYYDRSTSGG